VGEENAEPKLKGGKFATGKYRTIRISLSDFRTVHVGLQCTTRNDKPVPYRRRREKSNVRIFGSSRYRYSVHLYSWRGLDAGWLSAGARCIGETLVQVDQSRGPHASSIAADP